MQDLIISKSTFQINLQLTAYIRKRKEIFQAECFIVKTKKKFFRFLQKTAKKNCDVFSPDACQCFSARRIPVLFL